MPIKQRVLRNAWKSSWPLGVPCTMSAVTPYCVMIIARIRSAAGPFFAAAVSARFQERTLNRSSPATNRSSFLLQ